MPAGLTCTLTHDTLRLIDLLGDQAESKEANGGHISKELLRTSFVTLTQGSFILVSPKWGAAKALLEAERALLHTSQVGQPLINTVVG